MLGQLEEQPMREWTLSSLLVGRFASFAVLLGIAALVIFALIGCGTFAQPIELSSKHFRFTATSHTSSMEEMQEGIDRAEELYTAIAAIIPSDVQLDSVIEVRLNGNYRRQGPYVDGDGTIQLWRYSAEEGGYWALFAHELVHAIAFDAAVELGVLEWTSLGYYNEAWAEYVAQLIDPDKTGFPFYGFDEDVVVGHWVSQGGLSMTSLRAHHEELNLTCAHQSYTMRASWYRYVDETYGRQAALDIMFGGREMRPRVVQAILGDSLAEVDAGWRTWVLTRYAEHPRADAQTAAYRTKVGSYQPCQ
ncbi:MAG: hypothetical protein ACI9O6_001282 [Glaciecola sp.]